MFSGNNSPETVPLVAWAPENIVEIDQKNLQLITEHICKRCRYPLLALRLFLHVLCNIDAQGRVSINARHLSKRLDVNYDTVTKALKFLREINVLAIER
jgi:hypothetical protein|nr:hypothetical protein [uncultured Flavobacterium sp.]